MYSWLLDELEQAESVGVDFHVDGNVYTTADAERLYQVMENAYYMKSYIGDSDGKIIQIDFEHLESV